MARAAAAALLIVLCTLTLAPFCLAARLLDWSGGWPNAVIRCWARGLLRVFGIQVALRGRENLPAGPAVLAANHASAADIPILFGCLPVDFRIVHKRSLSFVPVLGWCLRAAGHVAIDRENPFRARRSLEQAARRVGAGTSVVVFPEGTRSPDGSVRHFKRGSFTLAISAGVPVVPVSLVGVRGVMPRGLGSLRRGTIGLRLHPAVATGGLAPEDAVGLAERVRATVAGGCEEPGR